MHLALSLHRDNVLTRESSKEEQELGRGGLLRQRWGHFSWQNGRHREKATETHLTCQTIGEEDWKLWVFGRWSAKYRSSVALMCLAPVLLVEPVNKRARELVSVLK